MRKWLIFCQLTIELDELAKSKIECFTQKQNFHYSQKKLTEIDFFLHKFATPVFLKANNFLAKIFRKYIRPRQL